MKNLNAMGRSMQGFTLIEILIVAFIIGLTASLMSLAISDDKSKSPPFLEAQTFIQTIDFVSEYSALNGEIIGMFVVAKSLEESSGQQWCYDWKRMRDGAWVELPEGSHKEHCMQENVQWELEIEGVIYVYDPDLEVQPPVLVFSPSGEATPVEMSMFENATTGITSEPQHIAIDMMGRSCWAENPRTKDSTKKETCNVR